MGRWPARRLRGCGGHAAVSGALCVCRCLEDKAREMNISDLASFYGSTTFTGAGFQLDHTQGVIAYHV